MFVVNKIYVSVTVIAWCLIGSNKNIFYEYFNALNDKSRTRYFKKFKTGKLKVSNLNKHECQTIDQSFLFLRNLFPYNLLNGM